MLQVSGTITESSAYEILECSTSLVEVTLSLKNHLAVTRGILSCYNWIVLLLSLE